ncbi:hypothetical protein B0H21DRAFT_335611 [Amylocystis lapponica]|nr:hypothetical protein B0H21DRAFT_335611 [Amylocystis lapponica]
MATPIRGSVRGGAPRGRGEIPNAFSRHHPSDRDIMDGLSPTPLQPLEKPGEVEGDAIKIKDLTYLGSYNWVDSAQPTIIVPGSPREWTERETPYTVSPDKGIHFPDEDGHRMPGMRYLPLFRAVDIVAEESGDHIDWSAVDIVTDRNGLRKLLRWIHLGPESTKLKEFRIDTQLAGRRTILFNRWEARTKERLSGGYGFGFKRESTVPAQGCEESAMASHHRIVKYDFDGLIMVVTFEVDAYLPQHTTTTSPPASSSDMEKLTDQLSSVSLPSGADPTQNPSPDPSGNSADAPDVKILRAGAQVPQDSLIELTTAAQMRWKEAFPQIYFSQTPNHFSASHEGDQFKRVAKRKLGDPQMAWVEDNAQAGFRQLRKALQDIQKLVVGHGERGRISLVCRDGKMEVFERTSQASCLPESVLERFAL